MPEEERRSRQIYRKVDIDIDGRDYAIDIFDGELPRLSEGDKYVYPPERAGIYNIGLIEKEDSDDKKCDKDHRYCHKHNRCERDDHDCDDKGSGGDGHDSTLDRRILDDIDYQTKLIKEILDDVRSGSGHSGDGELDRKILECVTRIQSDIEGRDLERDVDKTLSIVLTNQNLINRIISLLTNVPPPPPIPIPPPPSPSPSPPPPPSPIPPPPPAPKEQSHTRVIIQGEFDVPHNEITEETNPEDPVFQRQLVEKIVNQMKKENPDFKITKTLVARGIGPVKVAW